MNRVLKSDRKIGGKRPISYIDEYLGRSVRLARHQHGITQEQLAEYINVTHQQCQKYEAIRNRISASCLFDISRVFNKPLIWFYRSHGLEMSIQPKGEHVFIEEQYEAHEIGRAVLNIHNPIIRRNLIDIIQEMNWPSLNTKIPKMRRHLLEIVRQLKENKAIELKKGVL